jgi:hypothetical protein
MLKNAYPYWAAMTKGNIKQPRKIPVIILAALVLLEYVSALAFVIVVFNALNNYQSNGDDDSGWGIGLAVIFCFEILALFSLSLFFGIITVLYRKKLILREKCVAAFLAAMLLAPLCGWVGRNWLDYLIFGLLHFDIPFALFQSSWIPLFVGFIPGIIVPYLLAIVFCMRRHGKVSPQN